MLGWLIKCALATVLFAAPLAGQDFWLLPDCFACRPGSLIAVTAILGSRSPPGGDRLQRAEIADARLIGAKREDRFSDKSADARNVRLRGKPHRPGQYVVAVSLTPRIASTTQTAFLGYLRQRGAEEEAIRLSHESAFAPTEQVTYRSRRFAATVVEVGSGSRSFGKGTGYPIDFIPQSDPALAETGDTLLIRLVLDGHPLPGLSVHAIVWSDAQPRLTGRTAPRAEFRVGTDADGIARVPLLDSGVWKLSAARVILLASPQRGPEPGYWDVTWSTYVFHVSGPQRQGKELIPDRAP